MEITLNRISIFIILAVIFVAMSVAGCKKATTASTSQPVVVGYLIPGQPISIKVYQQKGLTDTATYGPAITGLALSLSDGANSISLTESVAGTYTSSNQAFLVAGKTYRLSFTYSGLDVSATTLMPAKPVHYVATKTAINLPPTSIGGIGSTDSIAVTFKWFNPDSLYHVLVFKNDDSAPFPVNVRNTSPANFTLNAQKTDHYDVYYRTFNYLGIYRAILCSVSKDYINALSTNANTSSQQLVNPPNNIVNGFGLFTAMQTDTIALTLTQY